MRVCLLGTYERDYPRNQILTKALRASGIDYFECHFDLWRNQPHKTSAVTNPVQLFVLTIRILITQFILIIKYLFSPPHDLVLFGYPGHADVVMLGWLPKLLKRPIIFDCFISLYDTAISDRGLAEVNSLRSKLLKMIDLMACKQSNLIILDTNAHIDFFVDEFKLPRNRFRRIFAGADTELFISKPEDVNSTDNSFHLLFIGKFTPLHGFDVILDAANRLKNQPAIKFKAIGSGQLFKEMRLKADALQLSNVEFYGWCPYRQLVIEISNTDLCLGIFSNSNKANRVIPNKIFQAAACGKPILTARSSACDEFFEEGKTIFYVASNNSSELADKIVELSRNRKWLAEVGVHAKKSLIARAGIEAIGNELTGLIRELT